MSTQRLLSIDCETCSSNGGSSVGSRMLSWPPDAVKPLSDAKLCLFVVRLPELLRIGPRVMWWSVKRKFSIDWPGFDAAKEKSLNACGWMWEIADIMEEPGDSDAADGVADLAVLRSHCSSSFNSSCSSGPAKVNDSKMRNLNIWISEDINNSLRASPYKVRHLFLLSRVQIRAQFSSRLKVTIQ